MCLRSTHQEHRHYTDLFTSSSNNELRRKWLSIIIRVRSSWKCSEPCSWGISATLSFTVLASNADLYQWENLDRRCWLQLWSMHRALEVSRWESKVHIRGRSTAIGIVGELVTCVQWCVWFLSLKVRIYDKRQCVERQDKKRIHFFVMFVREDQICGMFVDIQNV